MWVQIPLEQLFFSFSMEKEMFRLVVLPCFDLCRSNSSIYIRFHVCTPAVLYIYTRYTVHIHQLYCTYTPAILYIYTSYTVHIHQLYCTYTPAILYIYTSYTVHIHQLYCTYTPAILDIYTSYTVHIHQLYWTYTPAVLCVQRSDANSITIYCTVASYYRLIQ